MANKSKGEEHRLLLIQNAQHMLYERGYNDTSLRDLAALSHDNVAIFNYYFKSKYNMVFYIYVDIVNSYYEMLHSRCSLDAREEFILFNLIELKLCLVCRPFEKLYYELSQESAFINSMQNNFVGHILENYPEYPPERAILQALSVVHIKPAIITYDRDCTKYHMNLYVEISPDVFLAYYLDQLLFALEQSTARSSYFLELLHSLNIRMSEDFKPENL